MLKQIISKKSKRAFTLLEIVLSIGILLIISSFFIYTNTFHKSKQEQQIREFISDIRYIKQLSLQEKYYKDKDIPMIKIDISKNLYKLKTPFDDKIVEFKNGIKLKSASVDIISFTSSSWTKGSTIQISIDKKDYILSISAITGKINFKQDQ